MKNRLLFLLLLLSPIIGYGRQYVFFLHNRFLEEYSLSARHPEYGQCEYKAIMDAFGQKGFVVISELRPAGTDASEYARKVVKQIDSLMTKRRVAAGDITVVGTSKGGYIAQYVSGYLKNKDVNYVFVGSCDDDMKENPKVQYYGNVLSIYERSDRWHSCQQMRVQSGEHVTRFKEIELNTGVKHGFLYKALDEWIGPAVQWAKREYDHVEVNGLAEKIDSVLDVPTEKPFNGIVVVAKNGSMRYARCMGYSDVDSLKPLGLSDRFVVGSITKQFTAVLVLRAYDQGLVKFDVPIKKYLPALRYNWADSITIQHLITHTHGIDEDNPGRPLKFRPGSQFEYSQHSYYLMSVILMQVYGKSFVGIADSMFRECGMMNTYCPTFQPDSNLVRSYEEPNGKLRRVARKETFEMNLMGNDEVQDGYQISNMLVPAGGFVSTAEDLVLWNEALHHGKLLKKKTYEMMVTKQKNAVRDHPLLGKTAYGYGLTIDDKGPLQLGQTGRLPGFASMDYYFPQTGTSVVVLSNRPYYAGDLKKNFKYHLDILKLVRDDQKRGK